MGRVRAAGHRVRVLGAERPVRGERFTRKNTLVIAAGASNGGGMALRAVEDDDRGLIDGLVVTEPNIQPRDGRFTIQFGADAPFDPPGAASTTRSR